MPMGSAIVNKILERINQPQLVEILSDQLSGTELNSLLLEVFKRRTQKISAAELLNLYDVNRFVKPTDLPVLELKKSEIALLEIFEKHAFTAMELSPVSILGSCSVVATADQNKILSALRGTEVLADATNAIALHIASEKNTGERNRSSRLNYCSIPRHIRTQAIEDSKGFTPHFRIACAVTAGVDAGNYIFEKESLASHIKVMFAIFKDHYKVDDISFRFLCRSGYENVTALATRVHKHVIQQIPKCKIDIIERPDKDIDYYRGIQYKIDIRWKDRSWEIGDGGFVDWTQQLLQNKKERMLTTGIGIDLVYRIEKGLI
jgi:hypothetical protein